MFLILKYQRLSVQMHKISLTKKKYINIKIIKKNKHPHNP
jgi:hypothetical protein